MFFSDNENKYRTIDYIRQILGSWERDENTISQYSLLTLGLCWYQRLNVCDKTDMFIVVSLWGRLCVVNSVDWLAPQTTTNWHRDHLRVCLTFVCVWSERNRERLWGRRAAAAGASSYYYLVKSGIATKLRDNKLKALMVASGCVFICVWLVVVVVVVCELMWL